MFPLLRFTVFSVNICFSGKKYRSYRHAADIFLIISLTYSSDFDTFLAISGTDILQSVYKVSILPSSRPSRRPSLRPSPLYCQIILGLTIPLFLTVNLCNLFQMALAVQRLHPKNFLLLLPFRLFRHINIILSAFSICIFHIPYSYFLCNSYNEHIPFYEI